MPNDTKLGMVAGLGMVVAIALVFFHKESVSSSVDASPPSAIISQSPRLASGTPLSDPKPELQAQPVKFGVIRE